MYFYVKESDSYSPPNSSHETKNYLQKGLLPHL